MFPCLVILSQLLLFRAKMDDERLFIWFERIFTLFGMCSLPEKRRSLFTYFGQFFGMIFLFLMLFALVTAMVGDMFAFFQVDAIVCAICCTISIICHRKKMRKVFDFIHLAIEKSKNEFNLFCFSLTNISVLQLTMRRSK